LTAALVPLGDRVRDRAFSAAGIGYEVRPGGAVVALLSGAGLPPHTPVELVLKAAGSRPGQALMRRRVLVDSAGKVDMSLMLDSAHAYPAAKPLLVTGRWMERPDGLVSKQDSAHVQ
jgi:hypothetical protein